MNIGYNLGSRGGIIPRRTSSAAANPKWIANARKEISGRNMPRRMKCTLVLYRIPNCFSTHPKCCRVAGHPHLPSPLPPAVSPSFISCSSPGKKISCPEPLRTQKDVTHPIAATEPVIHHAMPTIPRSVHNPNQYPARIGPMVRKEAEHACPMP